MAEGLALGSGLARGFANVLLSKRQKDQEEAIRQETLQNQVRLSGLSRALDDGADPNVALPIFFPDLHFGAKPDKGQPNHNEVLAGVLNAARPKLQAPTVGAQVSDIGLSAPAEGILPSREAASPATPAPQASTGALGIPFLTPEQRTAREVSHAQAIARGTAVVDEETAARQRKAREDLADRLKMTPAEKVRYVATGQMATERAVVPHALGKAVAGSDINPADAVDASGRPVDLTSSPYWQQFQDNTGKVYVMPTAAPAGTTRRLTGQAGEVVNEALLSQGILPTEATDEQYRAAVPVAAKILGDKRDLDEANRQSLLDMRRYMLGSDIGGGSGGTGGTPQPTGGAQVDPLQGLSPADKTEVEQLANYTRPLSLRQLNSPRLNKLMAYVQKINPDWDATRYQERQRARIAWTTGKPSENDKSLNTVAQHLSTLADKAMALKNADTKLWNSLANTTLDQSGDPRVQGFLTAVQPVASELTNLFRGGVGAEADIQAWAQRLNKANSPAQFNEVLSTLADIVGSRETALEQQWQSAGINEPLPGKSAKVDTILAKLRVLGKMGGGAKPPGTVSVTLNGKTYSGTQTQIDQFKRLHPDAK